MTTVNKDCRVVKWIGRVRSVIHRHGYRGAVLRVMTALQQKPTHRTGFFLIRRLDSGKISDFHLDLPDITIQRVLAKDVDLLTQMERMGQYLNTYHWLMDRLNQGDVCYAACQRARLVGYLWISIHQFIVPHLGRQFMVNPDEIYYYDAFTIPEYRGKGINPALAQYSSIEASREYGRVYGLYYVQAENRSSLKVMEKIGAVRGARVGRVDLWGLRFYYRFGRIDRVKRELNAPNRSSR